VRKGRSVSQPRLWTNRSRIRQPRRRKKQFFSKYAKMFAYRRINSHISEPSNPGNRGFHPTLPPFGGPRHASHGTPASGPASSSVPKGHPSALNPQHHKPFCQRSTPPPIYRKRPNRSEAAFSRLLTPNTFGVGSKFTGLALLVQTTNASTLAQLHRSASQLTPAARLTSKNVLQYYQLLFGQLNLRRGSESD